jgi:hypothetical protein
MAEVASIAISGHCLMISPFTGADAVVSKVVHALLQVDVATARPAAISRFFGVTFR